MTVTLCITWSSDNKFLLGEETLQDLQLKHYLGRVTGILDVTVGTCSDRYRLWLNRSSISNENVQASVLPTNGDTWKQYSKHARLHPDVCNEVSFAPISDNLHHNLHHQRNAQYPLISNLSRYYLNSSIKRSFTGLRIYDESSSKLRNQRRIISSEIFPETWKLLVAKQTCFASPGER